MVCNSNIQCDYIERNRLFMDLNKKVSVIMGIYNCESTLTEAIESIFDQTYTNWELIMCDDGSSDATFQIASKFKNDHPDKIILLKNFSNMGLNYTLNKCLHYAKGDYIARMDADDISLPKRFEKEVEFLNNNNQYSFVSASMFCFDESGIWGINSRKEVPEPDDIVKSSPFCHPPCMIRAGAFHDVQGYSVDKKLLRVEDYHLWLKMYKKGYRGYNLQEPLYKMRDDRAAAKRRTYKSRINEAYVKCLAIKEFHLPKWNYIYIFRPLLVGLLPIPIYMYLHKKLMNKK